MDAGRHTTPARHLCALLLAVLAAFSSVRGDDGFGLYPYGPEAGDSSVGDIGIHDFPVSLPIPMKYYGQTFDKAYIVKDGLVSLEPYVKYLEVEWREGAHNLALDRAFLAPFYYEGYVPINNPDDYHGKIYYKLLSRARNDLSLSEPDRQLMLKLDDYVNQASVVLKKDFRSDFVLKVTWENVSSELDCDDAKLPDCPSNTFQLLIVANTKYTFAIFNYEKTEIPFTDHQLAGINGGHGRGWTDVAPCTGACAKRSKGDRSRIASLVSRGSRYVLVVNDDIIVRGGCLKAGLKYDALEVYPRQAGMFGGEMLSVSGLCSTPNITIYCRFGANNEARTQGVMETSMRGRCPVPILTVRGQVLLEMSTDNVNWKTRTFITIIHPGRLPPPVDLKGLKENWYQIHPKDLKVRWRKELFSSNVAATLNLNLIGYREDRHASNPLIMKPLERLASEVMNSDERLTVDPSQFACSGDDCQNFEIALLQLRVADKYVDDTTKYQSINVGPVTLGWYVDKAMTEVAGRSGQSQWPEAKCREWSGKDRLSADWMHHLLPCPCTLSQALADWGRWQPDMGCNMFTGSVCHYHKGAKHCVRSVHPSPDHSGNQCCYENSGNLRYAADSYDGSTPDRSHDWGSAPFGAPDQVPSLSHWLHDVVTFYYCCLWVEDVQCHMYMDRRATRDCKQYRPPHSAAVYGDPHITTFDGTNYHFGAAGDFWLLKSDLLNVQGRFEQRKNEYLEINTKTQFAPTNLTSLVMWKPGCDIVTINMAPLGGPSNRKLDVRVGSKRWFFEKSDMMWQDFHGVSIVNNEGSASDKADKQHSNFTVLFVGGAAVQVAERQGLFHAIVVLPPESKHTKGLLGTLDGNQANDFTAPSGHIVPADAHEDVVYKNFSVLWHVADNESMFHWPKKLDNTRTPMFGDPQKFTYKSDSTSMRPTDAEVRSVCGDSDVCRRDYYVSADRKIAAASKKAEKAFQSLQHSQATVRTCGLLDIPMAQKSPTVYRAGSVVTVIGCRPQNSPVQGSGPVVYTCSNDTQPVWSPDPDRELCPHTDDLPEPDKASDVGMIVGIVVGVVLVIVIVVIIVVIVIFSRRRGEGSMGAESGERPVPAKRSNVPSDVVVEPGTDRALLKKRDKEGGAVKMSEVITEMRDRRGSQEEV